MILTVSWNKSPRGDGNIDDANNVYLLILMMTIVQDDIIAILTVSWNISSGAPVYLKLEASLLKAPASKQALFP